MESQDIEIYDPAEFDSLLAAPRLGPRSDSSSPPSLLEEVDDTDSTQPIGLHESDAQRETTAGPEQTPAVRTMIVSPIRSTSPLWHYFQGRGYHYWCQDYHILSEDIVGHHSTWWMGRYERVTTTLVVQQDHAGYEARAYLTRLPDGNLLQVSYHAEHPYECPFPYNREIILYAQMDVYTQVIPFHWAHALFARDQEEQQSFGYNVPDEFKSSAEQIQKLSSGEPIHSSDQNIQGLIDTAYNGITESGCTALDAFRLAMNNWELFSQAPFFEHVANLVAIAIGLGFLPETTGTFERNGIVLFQSASVANFRSAFSIVDATVKALNYFVEATLASWDQGSLEPYLMERTHSALLDATYERISRAIDCMRAGQYYEQGGSWYKLFSRVENTITLYERSVLLARTNQMMKRVLSSRLDVLRSWRIELMNSHKSGELVSQPVCWVLYGQPGCGKSVLQTNLMRLRSLIHGEEWKPEQVAHILPDDKYHSSVTNSTRYLLYNDVGNRYLDQDPSNSVATMLQAVDNVRFTAVSAAVESKGNIKPNLLGVFGTTNNRELHLHRISTEPNSLRRRITMVDVVVREEYRNDIGGLDKEAFRRNPRHVIVGGQKMNDFQTFTINEVRSGGYEAAIRKHKGKMITLKNLTLAQFYFWAEVLMTEHVSEQKEHIDRERNATLVACPKCRRCTCCCTPANGDDTNVEIEPCEVHIDEDDPPREQTAWFKTPVFSLPSMFGTSPNVIDASHDPAEEKQAGFVSAASGILSGFARDIMWSRMGIFSPGWMNFYYHDAAVESMSAVGSLMHEVNRADYSQWWYWIPDSWWPTVGRFGVSGVLLDVELRKRLAYTNLIRLVTSGIGHACLFSLAAMCITTRDVVQIITRGVFNWTDAAILMGITLSTNIVVTAHSRHVRAQAHAIISRKRDAVQEAASAARARYSPHIRLLLGALGVLGAGALGYYAYTKMMAPGEKCLTTTNLPGTLQEDKQGPGDSPIPAVFLGDTDEALEAKNAVPNTWEERMVSHMCTSTYRNPTMTHEQLCYRVKKNITVVHVLVDGKWKYFGNIFFICDQEALCPAHFITVEPRKWRLTDNDRPGSASEFTVSVKSFTKFQGADMGIVHIHTRSKANLVKYVNHIPAQMRAVFLRKDAAMRVVSTKEMPGIVSTTVHGARIFEWTFADDTAKGFCGGVYVSTGPHPAIVGVHYACQAGVKRAGRSWIPSQADIEQYFRTRVSNRTYLPPARMPEQIRPIVNDTDIFVPCEQADLQLVDSVQWVKEHSDDFEIIPEEPEAPTEEEEKQGAAVLGVRPQRAFYKSRVVKTPLQAVLADYYPDCNFGPPRFGRGMWAKSAVYAMNCTPGFPAEHLEWAVDDYMTSFEQIPPSLLKYLRPLTWVETLNGIDGVRFIDSMNYSTAMGLGFPGGKRKWIFEYLDEQGNFRKDFLDEVKAEVAKAYIALRKGERPCWIYSATPKDEPTPVEKEKVRLFMVGQVSLVILCRMYFTPICRILQMMTGRSECAVGVNCVSRDWEVIATHLERFDRVFDGDYSKYDLRKCASTSAVSYRIMLEIARLGKYSLDDLYVMTMMTTEFLQPMVNYNGEVFLLDGSTPSGIPLTVIVNGLDNSIMNRCAYHSVYPRDKPGSFRQHVAHINYGDDFINAVSYWRQRFNFVSMQAYLSEYGVKITPGIKDAEARPFVDRDQLVFLQRKSVDIPGLDFRVGALGRRSVVKPLLSVLRSKEMTLPEQTALSVDNALREAALHGDWFEELQTQLKEATTQSGMAHLCRDLKTTRGEMLRRIFPDECL